MGRLSHKKVLLTGIFWALQMTYTSVRVGGAHLSRRGSRSYVLTFLPMFGCWCFVCLSLLLAWTLRHLLFSVDTILLTSGSRKLWEGNNHRQENGHICSLQQPDNHLLGLCSLRPSCKDKDIAIGLVYNSLWHCSFICLRLLLTRHKCLKRAGILYVVWIVAEHHYLWEWWTALYFSLSP